MEKPDVFFCIGTNMTECHPVAATRLKRGLARGAKLIVADPRHIPLAEMADLYLPLRVGSDVALLLAMAHVIAREGLVDEGFVAERTAGAAEFLAHLRHFPPSWAEPITGVPAADIEKAALWYGQADRGAIYYTLGITEHICGVDNVQSLCNLALMTGNLGREGTGINPLRGQNNIQGAGDCGAVPGGYPGNQNTTDPAMQAKFSALYGREMDLDAGMTKVRALDLCGDQIRAMLIAGENTVVSDPDRQHCEHALRSLEHLVVIDIFPTETSALAHVVLPATAWGETEGTCTNTERRVQRLRAAVPPQGEARPDWWIISQLARRLGIPGFEYQSAAEVFDELCQVSPLYAGLSWERVGRESLQWPVPTADHPGTAVLHEGEFKNGRGLFKVVNYRDPAETLSPDFPVWLTTGRRLQAYHTRTQTGRAQGIDYLLAEESLEVHPDDARNWGLAEGAWCRMASARGAIELKVHTTRRSPRGTVFCSFAFNEAPVNMLTGSGYDPVTQTAELKVCPVHLEPIPQPQTV
ncbi:MAG: molybdopterin-dependent oxidoreductase [Candidatus Latescibacteria bacterium]|nr:molybdopterin-dependent oxidoreductase [Candidatus Latescibacterota bacterium]